MTRTIEEMIGYVDKGVAKERTHPLLVGVNNVSGHYTN